MTAPSPRSLAAAAWDSVRRKVVLFGGRTLTTRYADTWEWNGTTWTASTATGPAGRANHAMVYDAARQVVVLFGGSDNGQAFGDTWTWNGTTWTQVSTTGPAARSRHRMAYDAQRQRVVLFGGVTGFATLAVVGDTWEWDGVSWTQRTFGSAPSARNYHAMAYDPVRQRVMLNGGSDGSNTSGLTDTWTYDGVSWTLQGALSAGAYGKGASFDERRQRVIEFGGYSGPTTATVFTNELWEWDGSTWAPQTAPGPSARRWPAMAWDGVNQKTLLFGGEDGNGFLGDTWQWGL